MIQILLARQEEGSIEKIATSVYAKKMELTFARNKNVQHKLCV